MDYIEIAARIAGAEDPYSEFEKEATSLNEVEKTSLARAFNKQMFLAKLDNRDGDGHLDFEVIVPETIGTHVPKSDTESNMLKTASRTTPIDKSDLITDDMFVLESRKNTDYSSPYDTGDLQKITMNAASVEYDSLIVKTAEDLRVHKIEKKAEVEAEIVPMVVELVKIARDASESRTLIMHAIDKGQEDLIPSILNMSQSKEVDIKEASLCDMGEDKVAKINELLDNISYKKIEYEAINNIKSTSEEKTALVGKALLWGGKKLASGAWGATKGVAKGGYNTGAYLFKSPKATGAVTVGATGAIATDVHKANVVRHFV